MVLEKVALLVLLALAACNSTVGTELTRATAKSVVNPIIAQRFPGIPLEPATDCVIDNATGEEIVTLATAVATQDDSRAIQVVGEIVRRPEAARCLVKVQLRSAIRRL